MRDKHDAGIKQMCSSGISFGRSKLLQSCSNLRLKPALEPAVTACLAGKDAQAGFVYWICPYTERQFKAITILAKHLQCRYSQDRFFRKKHYINTVMNELLMVCNERAEALVKTIRRAF